MSGGGAVSRPTGPVMVQRSRADIIDRNGQILAKNIYKFNLEMDSRRVQDKDRLVLFVRELFPDISTATILHHIESGRRNIVLRTDIGRDKANAIRRQRIEGLVIVQRQAREYPMQNAMSHIVGFVHSSGQGAEGLELILNERLSNDMTPVRLSIDSRIQGIMRTELNAALTEFSAKSAMGILMNARTGEILAIVNVPDFDPENINKYPVINRRFRIMQDNFEMGSIFKIFTSAMALANGMPPSQTFDVVTPFLIAGRPVGEVTGFRPPARNLNIAQIFQFSSNSGSAQIALSFPDNVQQDFFRDLLLYQPIQTDFGRTARPIRPRSNTKTDRSRWAFGHGISVTPMHLMLASNAMINDGMFVMPTIFRRDFVPQSRQIIPREVSRQIRQMMYVTGETTGRQAANQIHGIRIGGKTSTAEKPIAGGYSRTEFLTGYFVAFPIEAPKYSMLILLDRPMRRPVFASQNAVPLAGRIMNAVIPML